MSKYHFWYGLIIAVLVGVIFYLVYGIQNKLNVEQRMLQAEISVLEGEILAYKLNVKSLQGEIAKREERVDSLKRSLDSTAEDLKQKRKELKYYANKFKGLSDSERDSILREFVRSNQ